MKLSPKSYFPTPISQSGSIAMYMTMIISVLLLTTTTLATRLSVSELEQSSDVDRSMQAYYAAEAGLEEAIRRLDANRNITLEIKDIFPEQFSASSQPGDRSVLIDNDGNSLLPGFLDVQTDNDNQPEIGQLAWRQRKVVSGDFSPVGTQVKDETIQLDVSELRRDCPDGSTAGEAPNRLDCNSASIFSNFEGVEYCWTPRVLGSSDPPVSQIELTAVSWPVNNITNTATRKVLIRENTPAQQTQYMDIAVIPRNRTYAHCFDVNVDPGRRYIFRIKALFDVGDVANPDSYQLDYQARLKDAPASPYSGSPRLYIPNNVVLIDVVGQSGDIRRRIVARKDRQGRILGLFDYVLYSGDPELPLCKAGVQQSDSSYTQDCIAVPANN